MKRGNDSPSIKHPFIVNVKYIEDFPLEEKVHCIVYEYNGENLE